MRKINLFLVAVLAAFASLVKVSAQTSIEGSPAGIDFSNGGGNYVLFYSNDESLKNVDMANNDDTQFGYYSHWFADGKYQKFPNHYATKAGTIGWCRNSDEWFYVLDSGVLHPLDHDSPAIMFTAPADGWYYVGMTFKRDNGKFNSDLSIRNRFVHIEGSTLYCPYTEELCSMKFGYNDGDWHTMDYFVKLKAGDKITTEEYAEGRASSGGVTVSRYVVAANTVADTPISDEFVKSTGLPSYDPRAKKVVEPAEGKYAFRVVGSERYLVKKEQSKGNYYYGAIFTPSEIKSEASKKNIPLSDFDWEFDLVKNEKGGYNIKLGDYYMVSDGYIHKTESADNNRFTFYTPEYYESGIAIKRETGGKYWKDNMKWVSPYNKLETSTDPLYIFELVEAPAATPYAFFNFDMAETATDNLKAVANRKNYTVNVNLTRSLSDQYWNTFCVPFDISAEKITERFGQGTLVTEFTGVEGTTMMLTSAESIVAGKPYLVKPANSVVNPSFSDVKITAAVPTKVSFGEYSFTGVYGPTTINTDGTDLFVTSTGGLSKPADNTKNTIKGMRAYITVPSGTSAKLSILGNTTSVDRIAVDNDADHIYNINGQRLNGKAKGIVVTKGKKYVAK